MTRVLWRKLRKLMSPWEREFRRSPKIRSFWRWVCSKQLQDCHMMYQTKHRVESYSQQEKRVNVYVHIVR